MSDQSGAEASAAKSYVSFDPIAQDYDISRGLPPEAQLRICARIRDVTNWQPGEIFLDAGTGTGRFAVPLARLGVPVVGVDVSINMLAQMRLNREAACREIKTELPLWAVRGDLRRMPVASSAFKAVLIVHILHLIVDWTAVLDEVQRVLKPGGVLMMAKQGGERTSTRAFYNDLARERGLLATSLGAYEDEVSAYITGQGARIDQVEMSDIIWTARRPVSLTLELLRRRTWSSLREISDADNAALLAETTTWARERYGSLDAVEENEGTCILSAVRW